MMKVLMTADTVGGVWTYALQLARAASDIEFIIATMGRLPSESQRIAAGALPNVTLISSDWKLEWMDDPWDDLVRERIFGPLGMTESFTSVRDLAGKINVATPHSDVNDTLLIVPWHNIDNIGPAGSINSNVSDMIKWVRFQLAQGSVSGKPLVSASALGETHTAQMVIPVGPDARQLNPYTHLNAYGMGWFLGDYRGRELDQHGGNIDGMSAMVAVMPEEKIGMVILTNANGSPVPSIALYRVLDGLLNEPARDWNGEYRKTFDKARAQAKEAQQKRLAQRIWPLMKLPGRMLIPCSSQTQPTSRHRAPETFSAIRIRSR